MQLVTDQVVGMVLPIDSDAYHGFVDREHIIFHEKSPRESLLSRVERLTT